MVEMPDPILDLVQISKSYPGVRALADVSLAFSAGEVVGLIGENGAGKSTLMNVLGGNSSSRARPESSASTGSNMTGDR